MWVHGQFKWPVLIDSFVEFTPHGRIYCRIVSDAWPRRVYLTIIDMFSHIRMRPIDFLHPHAIEYHLIRVLKKY